MANRGLRQPTWLVCAARRSFPFGEVPKRHLWSLLLADAANSPPRGACTGHVDCFTTPPDPRYFLHWSIDRVLGFDCGLCAAARRSEADARRAAASAAAQVSRLEEQVRGLRRPSPPSSLVALGGDVVVDGGHSDAAPSCHVFLEFMISGGFDEAGHDDVLWRIASTILLRRDEDQVCMRQSNGQSRV